MVKLIRLKGDSAKNNKEIRNIFSDSITLGKNSRLALRSAKVTMLTSIDQEDFPVPADTNYQYQIAGNAQIQTVVVPQAIYTSANALLRAVQIAANSTLSGVASTSNEYYGIHNHWYTRNNNAILDVYRASESDAGFTSWTLVLGAASDFNARTATRIETAGDTDVETVLAQIVPLVNNSFTFNFDNVGQLEVGAVTGTAVTSTMAYGVKYDLGDGQYKVILNDLDHVDTGVAFTGQDNVAIEKKGSKLRVIIKRLTGVEAFNQEYDIPQSVLDVQNLFWGVNMFENGSTPYGISNASCVALEKLNPTVLQADIPVDIELTFNTPSKLSSYLGFPDKTYKSQGQPATFQSPRIINGVQNYPSVLLTILGLDLDSYTGGTDKQPRNLNIVDVLYPQNNVAQIEYIVNNPLKLDIKNSNPIVIRDLTMAFVRDDTGQQLEFIGNPIIVLEIYDEDES